MYGWRGRIGILIPASDTTMEAELNRMSPQGVSVHTARMELSEFSVSGLERMANETEKAAKRLVPAGIDVLVFGCTSGSFIKGKAYDEKIRNLLTDVVKKPCTTVAMAAIETLKSLKIKKISVLTPYPPELNILERQFIESFGFTVVSIGGADFSDKSSPLIKPESLGAIGYQDPTVAYRLARRVVIGGEEAIFISCTGFRTIEIIECLEGDLGIPVISSNQSAMAWALRTLNVKENLEKFGSLLANITSK